MSYTRRFKKTIDVHYNGSISYPASQNGGTKSYSGTVRETIVFDVEVNTTPFEEAVDGVNKHVDLLTGSVVATEAAHVANIHATSKKIGDTIVSGFFKTVKSDISQQIAELKTRADALAVQLGKLAQRCSDKQRQMGVDYQRISDRYNKIFTDLNNELKNRVYSIDEPVFHAKDVMDGVGSRTVSGESVTTVSISAGENAQLHSMLTSTLAKRRAVEAIKMGKRFLDDQYATNRVIKKCLLKRAGEEQLAAPFVVMETAGEEGITGSHVYASPMLQNVGDETLRARVDRIGWRGKFNEAERRNITDYFNQSLALAHNNAETDHDKRVASMISRLYNISETAKPNN